MSESVPARIATDARLLKRSCESLLGIAAGLLADGELNALEIQFLSTWLSEHKEVATTWPGEIVYKRVRESLHDGVITSDEKMYLQETLMQLIGGSFSVDGCVSQESTDLPIDHQVEVVVPSALFCFTGTFVFGTRSACERAVQTRGGAVGSVSKSLNYLVIGELSTRSWKYSSFGTKIEGAIKLREAGSRIAVVSEAQWVRAL